MRGRKRALLSGATGYIGGYLLKKLLKDSWDVDILVRDAEALQRQNLSHSAMKSYVVDGNTETIVNILEESRPDVVFHLVMGETVASFNVMCVKQLV